MPSAMSGQNRGGGGSVLFVRQPIFDTRQHVIAHELLYHIARQRGDEHFITSDILRELLLYFQLDKQKSGRTFVNVTWSFLQSEIYSPPCPDTFALEVHGEPGDAEDGGRLLRVWKNKGFTIAINEFAGSSSVHLQLLDAVDIVKVDIMSYGGNLEQLVEQLREHDVKLLAVEVETHGQFELCKRLGFDLFQGYFFRKPSLLVGNDVLDSNKGRLLQLMHRIMEAESPQELENDIAHDLALSYKLLCYINSASIGLRRKVDSIGHALVLLGLDNLRAFVSRLLMLALSDKKPEALLACAFARGRFLELLAMEQQQEGYSNDYFVLGMFSLLDTMLDMPLEQALAPASLPALIKDGLFRRDSEAAMRLQLICALERADWSVISGLSGMIFSGKANVALMYRDALTWADEQVAVLNTL